MEKICDFFIKILELYIRIFKYLVVFYFRAIINTHIHGTYNCRNEN